MVSNSLRLVPTDALSVMCGIARKKIKEGGVVLRLWFCDEILPQ